MRAALAALLLSLSLVPAAAVAQGSAEAVVKVGFPRGNPFGKHKLPELQLVDTESQAVVASVRASEWTALSATYKTALPKGKVYALRWAVQAEEPPFAEVPVAESVEGTVTFRIPYVPRARRAPPGDTVATASR